MKYTVLKTNHYSCSYILW